MRARSGQVRFPVPLVFAAAAVATACGGDGASLEDVSAPPPPLEASRPAGEPRDVIAPDPAMSHGGWADSVGIEVPPAPDGSEPRVALTANHMVPDGILGVGYQLDVGSSIVRRGGNGGVPGLVEEDSYWLDGRRLVQVSAGATLPGQDPPETYQPESFDGSQLEYHEDTNTWTLGRDGWTFTYGSTTGTGVLATRLLGQIAPQTELRSIACNFGNRLCNTGEWLLSRVEDPHHNVITYDYVNPELPGDLYDGYGTGGTGEHLLDVVRYNGADARINFVYERRPDAQLSYAEGAATFSTKRLSEIVTYSRTGAKFSHYRIDYKDESATDCDGNSISGVDLATRPLQSLVQRIVRIAVPGHADSGTERVLRCVQTHSEAVPWAARRDVTEDIPQPLGTAVPDNSLLPVPLHIDGDGKTDLILLAYDKSTADVSVQAFRAVSGEAAFLADGDEVDAWVDMLRDTIQAGHFRDGLAFAFTDLNRDGWTDLVYETVPGFDEDKGDVEVARWEPNTRSFDIDSIDVLACDLRHGEFADINGDGFADLVRLAHAADDDCIERGSQWLPNSGLTPWLDRGDDDNGSWLDLDTPAAAIADATLIGPPLIASAWDAVQYVEGQGRLSDLNGDGLADLTYAFWEQWDCNAFGINCEPQWDTLYSRIYWGTGYGAFEDSGLAAGGPVLTRRSDATPNSDGRMVQATQAGVDFMRSGRRQLVTTNADDNNTVFGAKWRGIRWGFGDDEVIGAAQPADSVTSDFSFVLPQQPGLGDECWDQSSWLTYGDFDGDGFTDVLSFNLNPIPLSTCSSGYCVQLYSSARTASQGRITSSDGSWGGRTSLTWRFSGETVVHNESHDYPGNAEVLTEVDGEGGNIEFHYGHPAQSQGRFRGFGLVEREGPRGGLERFAFGVSPALAGKMLYAARFRRDNTLERATVFAYEAASPCLPNTLCAQNPVNGAPSSYTLDTTAPYANLPVRQCEYEVERIDRGDDGNVDVPGLINHCYRWGGRVAPSHGQILAAAGLYRYPTIGFPAYALSLSAWEDDDRTGHDAPLAIVMSDASEPDGSHSSTWSFGELFTWVTGAKEVGPRWIAPFGIPMPPEVDLEQLVGVHDRAKGTGFSAYLVDRTYGSTARELVDEMLHRDVLTTDDDIHRVSEWESTSTAQHAKLWRRVVSTELFDKDDEILSTVDRAEFDLAHVDAPGRVTTCGTDRQDCRDDRYTYHANGELATHTRPDLSVESSAQSPFCGVETVTDPAGRQEVTVYDDRCRVVSRSFRGVVTIYAYDGQNRVTRRVTTPNGGAPATSVAVTIDDAFQFVRDVGYLEPRMRELREEDGRLWLTFLDDFGRLTKRIVCQRAPNSSPPTCTLGTEEVIEFNFWGTDGLLFASARSHVQTGPAAETPAFTAQTRDGAGRVILVQSPAHVESSFFTADWSATQTWYAPGRVVSEDILGRVTESAADTLHRSRSSVGLLLESAELDVLGNVVSAVGRDGIEMEMAYTPRHQLATETRVSTASSVGPNGQLAILPWVRRRAYDLLGRQTRVTDPDGTAIEVALDGADRVTRVSHLDAAGDPTVLHAITYTTLSGGVDEIADTDEGGHVVRRRVDGLDRRLREEDGLGTVTTWTYASGGQPSTVVEAGGGLTLTTRMTYDVGDRPLERTEPDGGITRYVHNGAGQVVEETDPNGVRRTMSYLFSGLPSEARLATSGGTWLLSRTRYDEAGRPRERIEDGVKHQLDHDDLDRLTRELTGENGALVDTQLTYEANSDRVLTSSTAVGAGPVTTTWTYDGWGRMRTVVNSDMDQSRAEYDVMDRVRREVDAEGFARETRYDARGRITFERGLGRNTNTVSYQVPATFVAQNGAQVTDASRVASTDGDGFTVERWFDSAGRLLGEARPDGTRSERRYAGRRLTDELLIGAGGAVRSITRTTYRTDGIVDGRFGPAEPSAFASFDPATFTGPSVEFGIGLADRVDWIDASGERTDFTYDSDGLLREERYRSLVHTVLRDFDAADPLSHPRVVGSTLARSGPFALVRRTDFEYDGAGRLRRRAVTSVGSTEESLWDQYDHGGTPRRSRNLLDGALQVEHVWNISPAGKVNSRQTTVAGAAPRTTRWTWFRNGVRRGVTGPSGSGLVYDYGPNFDHEVDQVRRTSGALVATVQERDGRGLATKIALAGGGNIDLQYDEMGRSTVTHRTGPTGAVELDSTIAYDDFGRIEREDLADDTTAWSNQYEYTPKGHLIRESRLRGGVAETLDYEVNRAGYRIATTGTLDGVDQTMDTEYDASFPVDRLTAVVKGGVRAAISYDPWDSVTQDQHGHVYTYAPTGAMKSATVDGLQRTFLRDVDGIPWGEDDGQNLRLTMWDLDPASRPVEVQDPTVGSFGYAALEGILIGRFDFSPSGFRIQSAGPGGTLLAESGSARPLGSAFGAGLAPSSAPGERMLYAGLEQLPGATDVHMARRRTYDAETGRFLALDPIGLGGGMHRALYSSGDPVNRRDPMGLADDCGNTPTHFPSVDPLPPQIIQGAGGGEASPFGPGVAVNYVDQYMGEKTFDDVFNKWMSDYLIASNAGVFSGGMNPDDDTDPSDAINTGGGAGDGTGKRESDTEGDAAGRLPSYWSPWGGGGGVNSFVLGIVITDITSSTEVDEMPGDADASSVQEELPKGEDTYDDPRSTIPAPPPEDAPPTIGKVVEVDAIDRSLAAKLKEMLDRYRDATEDPLHLESKERAPRSKADPVEVDGYMLRFAWDPKAYEPRVKSETSRPKAPTMSLEDALRQKARYEKNYPITREQQEAQPMNDAAIPIEVMILLGFPQGAAERIALNLGGKVSKKYADDAIRYGLDAVRNMGREAGDQLLNKVRNTVLKRTIRTSSKNGRLDKVFARVTKESIKEGGESTNPAIRQAMRALGLDDDDAGHMLAKKWGGQLDSVVPQNLSVNRGAWRVLEGHVTKEVLAGKEVHVLIEPIYESADATRPIAIDFMIRSDGNSFWMQFANPAR
jgi:RHS repeat-associated protein